MTDGGAPLAGVRVVDLTTVVAGPWATHLLAGYGADVIKIEPPEGDIMRYAPPGRHPTMGPEFLHMNAGKRSVALDLKTGAGREEALALIAGADVFLTNVRPAAMERLGLAYADAKRANPEIVYVGIVGFDQRGPYAARPAYDDLIQGGCGLASLFAHTGGEPRYIPSLIADRITGITAANAVLAALFARERGNGGASIEIPMFETMAELVLADHLGGHTYVPPAGDYGYQRILTPHRRPYRTSDGYVCVLLYTPAQWQRFFTAAGRAEQYAAEPRLSDDAMRREHYDYAYAVVADIVAMRTSAEWLVLLESIDVPFMPLHDVASLLDDPQIAATGFVEERDHPTEGRIRTLRTPIRWDALDDVDLRPAPNLGEHNRTQR
ncbi:CoA transferase [Vulcanimicrobium alpinum]|uniref:CoA transferase n=1 Tax=Vulcanimicrobium alpinum TaxID=3016050 RepID=A0AAN2CBC3_UNVUL|nr:CoA transferase [Vulcanimicrobium alpinum]BDE08081.1 CoA transferase [Vulcanimicrobium alpinum]